MISALEVYLFAQSENELWDFMCSAAGVIGS
jgi:hypothetical protein